LFVFFPFLIKYPIAGRFRREVSASKSFNLKGDIQMIRSLLVWLIALLLSLFILACSESTPHTDDAGTDADTDADTIDGSDADLDEETPLDGSDQDDGEQLSDDLEDGDGDIDGDEEGTELTWPSSPQEYSASKVSYINRFIVPPLDADEQYACCKDFGEISKDYIEDGTNLIDNAWAALWALLGGMIDMSLQEGLDNFIQEGDLIILLDHVGYDLNPSLFTIARLDCSFSESTTFQDANSGNGEFVINHYSFKNCSGEPAELYFPASIVDDLMTTQGDSFSLKVSFMGLALIEIDLHQVELSGEVQANNDHISYTNGTLSAYILLDDLYAEMNEFLKSPTCSCLELASDLWYQNDNGDWTGNCIPDAGVLCDQPEEEVCVMLATNLCMAVPTLMSSQTDLDIDPQREGYEAFSIGLNWTAVKAAVSGVEPTCDLEQKRCLDSQTYQLCENSCWGLPQACQPDSACIDGECIVQIQDLCTLMADIPSTLGCDFYALDLANHESVSDLQYSIIVKNPSPQDTVSIAIFDGLGQGLLLDQPNVPPQSSVTYDLPNLDVSGSGITRNMYHVRSSLPITIHQVNPNTLVDNFSVDSSTLYPLNALGYSYLALNWPARDTVNIRYPAYVSIVAVEEGSTNIEVNSPVELYNLDQSSVLLPNINHQFSIDQHQVLNLETGPVDLLDLSGLSINADKKIAVFSGNLCANVPIDTNYCDHLEEQLPPTSLWGTHYLASKSYPRGDEPDYWRILAAENDTTIVFDPPQTMSQTTLNAGELVEIASTGNFEIISTSPIMVGQYLVGSNYPGIPLSCNGGTTGIGDPSFAIISSIDSFSDQYILSVSDVFDYNYINIVMPAGTNLIINGSAPAGQSVPIGDGTYVTITEELAPGFYALAATQPFGIVQYGYACDVSYAHGN
jgi:hypothetical protein